MSSPSPSRRTALVQGFFRTGLGIALLALSDCAPATSTVTATLGVSATVGYACTLATTAVAFGSYNAASGTATYANGAVAVTCTSGTTYTIALDAGQNAATAGNTFTRRMVASGSTYLPYDLFIDSAYTEEWGNGSNSSNLNPTSGTFTGNGSAQSYTVYGRITAGNYVTAGSYSDTVTATVTYL